MIYYWQVKHQLWIGGPRLRRRESDYIYRHRDTSLCGAVQSEVGTLKQMKWLQFLRTCISHDFIISLPLFHSLFTAGISNSILRSSRLWLRLIMDPNYSHWAFLICFNGPRPIFVNESWSWASAFQNVVGLPRLPPPKTSKIPEITIIKPQ